MDEHVLAATAADYLAFAGDGARGRSPLYEELARRVAEDREVLAFLVALPPAKRQPNLLFAAVRHLTGTPADWPAFRRALFAEAAAVRALMLARRTQTNEPGRCATLLPVLAHLPQPLALLEVGTSGGLCLLPDYYGYDYGRRHLAPADAAAPVLSCRASAATPLPDAPPRIVWRAGLDLAPLDIAEPSEAAWLETLIWPEQTARVATLRAAIRVATSARPRIVQGDLRRDLARLAGEAPKDATLVIFHTAVLTYVAAQEEREAFASEAQALAHSWIANEAPAVFPRISQGVGTPPVSGSFLLSVNGAPVAWTDPHGSRIDWLEPRSEI